MEDDSVIAMKFYTLNKEIDKLKQENEEKDKLINAMKNFLLKTCMMTDFLEWQKDFDKVKENKE